MLTEVAIKNLKPKERPYKVADGRSLYMEVYPNGAKFWRVRYDVDGRETRYQFNQGLTGNTS